MSIDELTLGQLKEIAAMFPQMAAASAEYRHPQTGNYVIVRTYASGVWCAVLDSYDPVTRHALLNNARRLWSWSGAFTLSTVALRGVSEAKMPAAVDGITVAQVDEIIPTTEIARQSLTQMREYRP